MWKVSCLLLLLITIGKCSAYNTAVSTEPESSRNVRNYENRKHRSELEHVEYDNVKRPYEYSKDDSEEFEDGKLIGKWRNSGAALEPKWRDGDSVPLVPFNAAKQSNVGRHDVVGDSKWRDYSHAVTKANIQDDDRVRSYYDRESIEDSVTKISDTDEYRSSGPSRKDRYTIDRDYVRHYQNDYEDFRDQDSAFFRPGRKLKPSTILTDRERYEMKESTESSSKPIEKLNDDSITTRSRYRDTFQAHPNEYELNDEEYQKPRPRKRRPPQHYEFSEIKPPTYSVTWSTEKYSESTAHVNTPSPKWTKDPEVSTIRYRRPEEKRGFQRPKHRNRTVNINSQKSMENAELKSLLKMQQVEGLSLSELLQRRNLTLNDLLKGKPEVISVLKSSDEPDEDFAGISSAKPKIFVAYEPFSIERPRWRPSQPTLPMKNFDLLHDQVSPMPKNKNNAPVDSVATEKPEDDDSFEGLDSVETEDGQRKLTDNEKLSAIVRLTKPIILPRLNTFTEKPTIIITTTTTTTPTLSDRVTKDFAEVYQNDESAGKGVKAATNFDEDEIMEFSDFTIKKNVETSTKPAIEKTTIKKTDKPDIDVNFDDIYENSGSTISIEHMLSVTEQTTTTLPTVTHGSNNTFDSKANTVMMEVIRANNTDMFDGLDSEYQNDEPQHENQYEFDEDLAMGDQPYEETTINAEAEDESSSDSETLLKNHQIFSTSSKPYEVVISEIEPDARAEIFELFSSGSSAKRLERLLKSRNMSIDELIALRQRGSSKVHLAEVLKSREMSGPKLQKYRSDNQAEPELDDKKMDSAGTTVEYIPESTTNDLSDIEIDTTTEDFVQDIVEVQSNISSIGIEPTKSDSKSDHVELLELLTAFDSLPFSVRPDLPKPADPDNIEEIKLPSAPENQHIPDDFVERTKRPDLPRSLVEVGLVEEIAKDGPILNEGNNEDLSQTDIQINDATGTISEEKKTLSKVRPSIIASGAILGVTIVVFLAIFIVCRIRQKQKYTYRNTFSRAVFQGPAMTARKLSNSSSLNTIMVNVVATSTKRPDRHETHEINDDFECKSDIENDSLDANDSWDTIPDFMK